MVQEVKSRKNQSSIAETIPVIIGLSLKLPHIDNEEALWQFLNAGEQSRCIVDDSRMWRNSNEVTYANLFSNWDFFSPDLFNLSAKDIAHIDPQQKLALYGVHTCLENAGITRLELQQATTGVYAGVMSVDNLHSLAINNKEIDSRFFLNNCEASVANRVSHCFNFIGESKSINAACASSLIALKDACESIKQGQNDFAFVVGVNYLDSVLRHQSFKKAGMLSRNGWCNSFSIQADGYLPSEGMVTLLLTSKAKADALNANILAAIVGISCNHNGHTSTMTAPNAAAQSDLIAATQKQCDYLDVTYVEAHGTGTSLGDPIELEALSRNYPDCVVGSIKANVGHMEAGAGLLGVAKCLMILKNQQIPPHRLLDKANVLLPETIQINTEPVAYNHSQIAVSSFGFSGANAHAILQSIPKRQLIKADKVFKLPLLVSATNQSELIELMGLAEYQLQQNLKKDHGYNLGLNSIYAVDHYDQHRLAGWINNCTEHIEWISINKEQLTLPGSCLQIGDVKLRPYVQIISSTNLAEYWLKLINDFLPSVRCIEAKGRGVTLAIQVNQSLQTHLLLNGKSCPALVDLDNYVSQLVEGLIVEQSIVKRLIEESIELYQHQYTFKALIQTLLTSELVSLFEQHEFSSVQNNWINNELLLLLLWARITVMNKWQLYTIKTELLSRFPPAFGEIIALLEQKLIGIDEIKSLLNVDPVFLTAFKSRLINEVTSITEANAFSLLRAHYQPVLIFVDSIEHSLNQCTFHFKQGQSIIIDLDLVSKKDALTLSDEVIINLWQQGFPIDFCHYLGPMPFERHPYFKQIKKTTTMKRFYTLQSTLNCLNDSEFNLKKVCFSDFSVEDMLEQDVCIVLEYQEQNPIKWVMEVIRKIAVKTSLQIKKQRIIYLQLDPKYTAEQCQLLTHLVKAVNLEINPLSIKVLDSQDRYYQYDKVTLQFASLNKSGFGHQGLYVLVGGAGGLGLKIAAYLKKNYDAQVYILGRKPHSQLHEEVQAQLRQLNITYNSCDISENNSLITCLKQIALQEPITGIFHLAIERHDEWWIKQTAHSLSSTLDHVFQRNTWLFEEQLSQLTKTLYVFTSIQAYNPNMGATIYSFEAALKSYFATKQKSIPCFVTVLGVIEGVGLANSADYSNYMIQNKLSSLTFDEFITLFEQQIVTNTPFAMITGSTEPSDLTANIHANKSNILEQFVGLSLLLIINQYFSIIGVKVELFLTQFKNHFYKLVQELLIVWQKMQFIKVEEHVISLLWNIEELEELKSSYETDLKEDSYAPRLKLFSAVCRQYPELLLSNLLPQQVIFPNGSTELVQGFYEQHVVADYANQVLANKLSSYSLLTKKTIKILEVGAGSGASARVILAAMNKQPFIYYFTDISSTLVNKAKRHFSNYQKSMVFCQFNIDHMDSKHEFYQQFDFVIATNVVHATSDILSSLNRLSECLADEGHLLLNELVEKTNYTTAIFGLFDGWWNAKDQHLRQANSPLLTMDQWISALKQVGLEHIECLSTPLNFISSEQIVIDATIKRQTEARINYSLMLKTPKEQTVINTLPDTSAREQWLIEQLAQTLYLDNETIRLEDRLSDLGFDSLSLSDLYQKLRPKYPELGIAELFAVDTVSALIHKLNHFDKQFALPQEEINIQKDLGNASLEHYDLETDIAIVGLSYQLPHTGSDDFVSMLKQGKTSFGPIPLRRWQHDDFYDLNKGKQGKSYAHSASFLNDIDCFDEAFFKISPREAAFIDPQERLLLQNAYHALEDANAFPIATNNNVAVFVGISGAYYSWLGEDWTKLKHANSSCAYWSAANRISYSFNLHGPSMAIDTACSSSLSALHLACQSISTNESTMALVGGVNLIVHPRQMVELSDLHMLAATNINATFSKEADGFVYAEGIVALCIKKLKSAVEAGNTIYGVIKGSALNSGGKMHGYTVPNPEAQKQVIATALKNAKIDAQQIQYIEAHGTGTVLGDPIEIKALSDVYQTKAMVGSVKSNIGHSEACAGLAGMVKILLQYQYEEIFPGVNAWPLNEHCHFEKTQFTVPEKSMSWSGKKGLRYSAVSSFGAGGSNAHIILQDYPTISSMNADDVATHSAKYSFKKQVHWIVPRDHLSSIEVQQHPLLLETAAYYFKQHLLHQRPILPGVAHIYFCYQTYLQHVAKQNISIREIKWLKPVYADSDAEQLALMIQFKAGDDGVVSCELSGKQLHSSSIFAPLNEAVSYIDYAAFSTECVLEFQVAEMYAQFRQNNWYHGEAFQCVRTLHINRGKNKAVAQLVLAEIEVADKTLDPRLFDSVLQCVSVLQNELPQEQVYIPQGIEILNLYQSWTNQLYVVVEDQSIRKFSPRYNISIFDNNYQLITQIIGFCMIPIHKRQITPAEPIHYFKPFWQRINCDAANQGSPEWLNLTNQTVDCGNGTLSSPNSWSDFLNSAQHSEYYVVLINQLHNPEELIILLQNVQLIIQSRKVLKLILCFDDEGDKVVYSQAVNAYLRTAKLEFPKLHYTVVVLPWTFSAKLLPLIVRHQLPSWVRVTQEGFFHAQYYHAVHPNKGIISPLFKKYGVYVIAGGLGAIPQIIAQYLVNQYQAHVLLIGRRKPSIENSHWLQQNRINYKQADMSDYSALQQCIANFALEHKGVLNGCIQAAGVQQDGLILNQTKKSVESALAAKVMGTLNLDRATMDYSLDHFVMLSSYSSLLGNIGQSNYAAANGFLDGFAVLRESRRLKGERRGITHSINLPLWEQGGMRVSDSVLVHMQKEWGMQTVSNNTGCVMLETLLTLPWPQIIAHQGDSKVFLQQLNNSILVKQNMSKSNGEFKFFVLNAIKTVLELSNNNFDLSASFGDLGFNSILFTELANHLNDSYTLSITPATFFDFKTVDEFIHYYEQQTNVEIIKPIQPEYSQSLNEKILPLRNEEIGSLKSLKLHDREQDNVPTIIGYSALLPGCNDLNDFWQLLVNQQHAFSQTPVNRLSYMQQHSGAFINGVDEFDATFFNLSPLEAKVMDPQQRLLLQEVWHALEMAGINPQQLKGSSTGVYVGASTFDYAKLLTRHQINNPYIAIGTVHCLLANRISHYFDLCGPSEAVDTACSSSLYALDKAVKAIKQGEIDQAIVCGVNLLLDDEFFNAFTQSGMLSATSVCKPFDKNADGYLRGEGIVVIILQNQTLAQEQNNTVYARILGSGVNHTGKANTLTSPSSKAQQQLYEHIYANVDIHRVSYIEAHGTGTSIGDPIELEGLKHFVSGKKVTIDVGSVKGNIGHLEPASGLAGLVKVLLMFQHQMIPGQANLAEINPYLVLNQSGLAISQQTHPWPQSMINGAPIPRCAAVSSFGFGGVNAHVVLEQGSETSNQNTTANVPLLIPISAANELSLRLLIKSYIDWLQKTRVVDPKSLCFTLQKRRTHQRFRSIFQWHSQQQLIESMELWLSAPDRNIVGDYEEMTKAYLSGDAVFNDEGSYDQALPVHSTPAYSFLCKKVWFKTQENQLVYVSKDLVVDDQMKQKPLLNQSILILYSRCFEQTIKSISTQLESTNQILSYSLDQFDSNQFQHFLTDNPGIERFIIYPHISSFTLEDNLFNNDLLTQMQPLFALIKSSLNSRFFSRNLIVDLYSYAGGELEHPQVAMISGLLGSLAKELSHWQIKHWVIERALELSMLNTHYDGPYQTIQLKDKHYQVKALNLATDCDEGDFLSAQGVYLVLGGMGGIGRRLTEYLIDTLQAKVIIVGRSALDKESKEWVNTHANLVEFIQTDVTHETECALLIKYIQLKYPTIDAVFDLVMKLHDGTVDSMSWESFSEVIKAKLLSGYFIHQLQQHLKVNAAIIFSSMQSYACLAGQANYAAASCALDAYCLHMEKTSDLKVKIINWSIWQEAGAVTNSFYLDRARDLGFIPLTTQQAFDAMRLGLNSQYHQFAIQNKSSEPTIKTPSRPEFKSGLDGVNQFVHLLVDDLKKNEIFTKEIVTKYSRLANYLIKLADNSLKGHSVSQSFENYCQQDKAYEAYYRLCYQCYLNYEAILKGKHSPVDVVFSGNGLKLLSTIYAQSPESKKCNQQIATYVSDYLNGSKKRVKILELGAGVGATTVALIDALNRYGQVDYYYSDVSPFFLNHGQALQEQVRFNLHCETIDINHLSALSDSEFDIVVASNVIHIAGDLPYTLKEIKRITKPQGLFLLNEAVKEQAYLNFIFGLFDGWWQAAGQDRLDASPLLNQSSWHQKLTVAGFIVPESKVVHHDTAQRVFYCQVLGEKEQTIPFKPKQNKANEIQVITNKIAEFIHLALHSPKGQSVESNRPLAEIGLDSITGVSLITNINQTYNLSLRTSVIFDYPSLDRLAAFVQSELKIQLPVVAKVPAMDLFEGELIDD
ncbi:TPA: SDR family NAD(P)-dependent oxidoreductase [Legionella pneumophila]|nr:SDR family NAD(P)-dependent oxidoreductase [Legionella pneumophila]HCJ1112947.1 SDR family NAD(P)-dependent oxidoreductase [Legionella pneumophila]